MMVVGLNRISNRVMNLGDLVTEAARRYPARQGLFGETKLGVGLRSMPALMVPPTHF